MTTSEPKPVPPIEGHPQDPADAFLAEVRFCAGEIIGETSHGEGELIVTREVLNLVDATVAAVRAGVPDDQIRALAANACADPAPYDPGTNSYRPSS